MGTSTEISEELCLKCKRIIDEGSKFGLCPVCLNKYGTPLAILSTGGLIYMGKLVIKNSGKIIKGAYQVIKYIK